MFKNKIENFLNNIYFEKFIIVLILLNLIVFVLDTIKSFHTAFADYITYFEAISVAIFTIEYFLRVVVIKNVKTLFAPMMVIDFLAIAPYYLAFCSVNTVFLRVFRLSRILRILKIGRYSEAVDNIIKAFRDKKEELIITLSVFCIGILISSILIYFAENEAQPNVFSSIPKCFYFSIITFTSVGYGDISPVTNLGKIICSITSILGIGLHGLFIGVVGVAFMSALKKEDSKNSA